MSAIEMRYQKPLDDIPTFFEGSTETFSARAEKQWISNRKGKRGAGTRAYIDVTHDEFSGDNVTGFGLEIRW